MLKLSSSLFQYYTIPELTSLLTIYDRALAYYNLTQPVNKRPDPIIEVHIQRMNEIWCVRDLKEKENANINS